MYKQMLILALLYPFSTLLYSQSSWSYDLLIDSTSNIYIGKCSELFTHPNRQNKIGFTEYKFKIVEVLTGDFIESVQISARNRNHIAKSFGQHENEEFWKGLYGRGSVEFFDNVVHTFALNHYYILFVGSMENPRAAEILMSPNDKWLIYVMKRLMLQRRYIG